MLQDHPDKVFVQYILNGIKFGFRIGYTQGSQLKPTKNEHDLSKGAPWYCLQLLGGGVQAGQGAGILPPGEFQNIHINRFGVISQTTGDGASINDGLVKSCALFST